MSDPPSYDRLRSVDPPVLYGLVAEAGARVSGPFEHKWQRGRALWDAAMSALAAGAAGRRPVELREAPPTFLGPVVRERLELNARTWSQSGGFGALRVLERLGLVRPERDDTYVLAFVGSLGDRWGKVSRAEQVRADPGLLDVLWRVFEVEGGGEISLANVDKFSGAEAGWQATFLELVADGTLDRGEVLTACLDTLGRDFAAYRAGWFSALYTALEPTPAEDAARQDRLRDLLRSQVGATVSVAARRLRALSAAGLLDDEAVGSLAPGLAARAKGPAVDLLRVLTDVTKRRPDLRGLVAEVATTALGHTDSSVQAGAAGLLRALGAEAATQAAAADLAPSVRLHLGMDVAAEAPAAVSAPLPVRALVPVGDRDVLERTAALLEDCDDPLELELCLAGLAALGEPERLRPLAKRAARVLARGPREGVTPGWLPGHLARLVLAAAGESSELLLAPTGRTRFLLRRLAQVEDVLTGRRPAGELLATPTLAAGWVEPGALVDRLDRVPVPFDGADLAAALLRLGPEGRPDALQRIGAVASLGPGTIGVLRHALGAEPSAPGPVVTDLVLRNPALWVAASRARDAAADDPVLLRAGLDAAGQGRPVQADLEAAVRTLTYSVGGVEKSETWVEACARAAGPAGGRLEAQPTLGRGAPVEELGYDLGEWVGWLAAIAPHDLEPVLLDLLPPLLYLTHTTEVRHDAARVLRAVAAHPGRLGRLGVCALAAGLIAGRPELRVLGVDAAATFALDGRVPAADLAAALAVFAPVPRLRRWAASFEALRQALPGPYAADIATRLLPALDPQAHGLNALLDWLLDDTVRRGARVDDPAARAWLATVPGAGRARRAASSLLGL